MKMTELQLIIKEIEEKIKQGTQTADALLEIAQKNNLPPGTLADLWYEYLKG
jgi:hypothetical protein